MNFKVLSLQHTSYLIKYGEKTHQILHQPIIEKVSWKYVSVIAIDIHFIEFSVFAIYMLFNKMLDGFSVALGS